MDGRAAGATPATLPVGAVVEGARAVEVGDLLAGRYQLVRFIAAGGHGAVWEANDQVLGTAIAVKTLHPALTTAGVLDRLRREVLVAREVAHPSTCRIHGLEVDAGPPPVHFVAMELLRGDTLAAHVARGPIPLALARGLVHDLASGLAALHARGVIHRDLKAGNVIVVERDGRPRAVITDFGLARTMDGSDAPLAVTAPGTGIAGTPSYMAPEQLRGEPLSAAADLWALGVVVHELLTGRLPRSEATSIAAALAALDQPVLRLAATRADAASWQPLVDRLLAPSPAERGNAAAVLDALPSSVEARPRRRHRAIISVALGAAVVAGVVLLWSPARSPAADARPAGLAALASDDLLTARDRLRAHVAGHPDDAVAQAELAGTLIRLGEDHAAELAIAEAQHHVAGLDRGDRALVDARAAEVAGDWGRAVAAWQVVATYRPGDRETRLRTAHAELEAGRTLAAAQEIRASRQAGVRGARIDLLEARVAFNQGEHGRQLELARQAAEQAPSVSARAFALVEVAEAQARLGELDGALATLGDLERVLAGVDLPSVRARGLTRRAMVLWRQGKVDGARALLEEARSPYEAAGDRGGLASVEEGLGMLDDMAHPAPAPDRYLRALELYRQAGDVVGAANAQANLGALLLRRGAIPRAIDALTHSRATAIEAGEATVAAIATLNLAEAYRLADDRTAARTQFIDARKRFVAIDHAAGVANADLGLAILARLEGDLDEADRLLAALPADAGGDPAMLLARAEHALVTLARSGSGAAATEHAKTAADGLAALGAHEVALARDVEVRVHLAAGARAPASRAALAAAPLTTSAAVISAWVARVAQARADGDRARLDALAAEARAGGFPGLVRWAGL